MGFWRHCQLDKKIHFPPSFILFSWLSSRIPHYQLKIKMGSEWYWYHHHGDDNGCREPKTFSPRPVKLRAVHIMQPWVLDHRASASDEDYHDDCDGWLYNCDGLLLQDNHFSTIFIRMVGTRWIGSLTERDWLRMILNTTQLTSSVVGGHHW